MPSRLGQNLERVMREIDLSQALPLPDKIPTDPAEFYTDFGHLQHPLTRKPVATLAGYQLSIWRALMERGRVLVIKSQKVGLTTSILLSDFQLSILPSGHPLSCRGFDQLVLAQTREHAREHIRTLKKLIAGSRRYSAWLINRPVELEDPHSQFRDEQSRTSVLFIRNPDDESRPSRIISLGLDNAGSIQSWKNVHHIHISDATAAIGDISDALNFAISRLANTEGSLIMETPPSPPAGPIYELWEKYRARQDGLFRVFEVPATDAVKACVMTQAFLDSEKERDPVNFERLYGAKFTAHFGNVFSSELIERAVQLGRELEKRYGLEPKPYASKSQGHDPGTLFGSVVVQEIDNVLQVILAEESDARDDDSELYASAARIKSWPVATTQVDAAGAAFIASLKRRVGEDLHYERLPKERHRLMKVKPISFSTDHKKMLQNLVILMQKDKLAIAPSFGKLLTALRTAVATDWSLDKDKSLHHHVLDALRLACEPYSVK